MKMNTEEVLGVIRESWNLELQSILAALRGPDNEDEDLKKRTTGVIRARVTPCYDGVVSFQHSVILWNRAEVEVQPSMVGNLYLIVKNRSMEHFFIHVMLACYYLKIPIDIYYDGRHERYLVHSLTGEVKRIEG